MKNIKKDEWYTPVELLKKGIRQKNANEYSNHQILLRHIKNGKLKSKNIQSPNKPRYIILGEDALTYHKKYGKKHN